MNMKKHILTRLSIYAINIVVIFLIYASLLEYHSKQIAVQQEMANDIKKQMIKLFVESNIYFSIFLYVEAIWKVRKLSQKHLSFNIIWASVTFLLIVIIYQNLLTKTF